MRFRKSLTVTAGITFLLSLGLAAPAASSAQSAPNILHDKNLIYGSEIGAWENNGGPAVTDQTIVNEITAAKIPIIRYAVYDCFTDETCGNDHHTGTQSVSQYQQAITGITQKDHALLWLKMVPITSGDIGGITGTVFCPPANGSDWGMNLPMEEQVIAATAAVYKGPIVIESNNEAEYDCSSYWGFSSPGSTGVSADIGRMYAATMPKLVAYARSLGFSDVVSAAYIGVGGGPGWGNTCNTDSSATYGYKCEEPNYVEQFNAADKAAGGTRPDVETIHSYCHSPDFDQTVPYNFSDDECYAYYSEWLPAARTQVESVWGKKYGQYTRYSISEWNGGICDSSSACWSGYADGDNSAYVSGFLAMLKASGYWNANLFELASNPQGDDYNLIQPNGTTSDYYSAFKTASVNGQ